LERFEPDTEVIELLGCHHVFNPESIRSWFQTNVRCPICRYDIRDYHPEDSEESKEETNLEESKEETKEETNEGQNQIPNRNTILNQERTAQIPLSYRIIDQSNNTVFDMNTISNLTDNLLEQLLNPQGSQPFNWNNLINLNNLNLNNSSDTSFNSVIYTRIFDLSPDRTRH
jgi:uncharacterized Zn finger protein (UPF0148 family)